MWNSTSDKTTLIIGDAMLDRYVFGTVERISPEAPCPIFLESGEKKEVPGGAANVAAQISNYGGKACIGARVGDDPEGRALMEMLKAQGVDCEGVIFDSDITTVKTRYVTPLNQQLMRVDRESRGVIRPDLYWLEHMIVRDKDKIGWILLVDYNKGMLDYEACRTIIDLANECGIPTLVDIKTNEREKYIGATLIKGNMAEFVRLGYGQNVLGSLPEQLLSEADQMQEDLQCANVVITCGKEGIVAIDADKNRYAIPAPKRAIYDVTGAGDVVTAALCWSLQIGCSFEESLRRANALASQSVMHLGNELLPYGACSGKLISLGEAKRLARGKRTVFTNGCFDVFHACHADLLSKARSKGDLLIVALNSDASIRALKGEKRPVNSFDKRVAVLSALADVDYIIQQEDLTPERLIREIKPDVLVKGGDYALDEIVGADFVMSYGGEVAIEPHVYQVSTTQILEGDGER